MDKDKESVKKTVILSLENWQKLNQVKIDNNLPDLDAALSFIIKRAKK